MDYRSETTCRHRPLVRTVVAATASVLLLTLAVAAPAGAHSGSVDSFGCHPNVAHGSYHCHTGPLAGRSYPSRAAMIKVRQEHEQEERAKARLLRPEADGPTSTIGDR